MSWSQYGRFVLVGGFVGVVTVACRELIGHYIGADTPLAYSASVALAYAIGILLSFTLNRRFTFTASSDRGYWLILLRFAALALVGMACTWLLAVAFRYGLLLDRIFGSAAGAIAFAVAAVVASLITYFLNARYVFSGEMRAPSPLATAQILAVIALSVVLAWSWARQINDRPIDKDAAQTVTMAVNLQHRGVISMDDRAPFTATDYREPIPVLACALGVKLLDYALGSAPVDSYLTGERVRYLKYQNLVWLALLAIGTFLITRYFTSSFVLALLAVVIANTPFIGHNPNSAVNDLMTEIPAAALLMWASFAFVRSFDGGLRWAVGAGLLFGALTLTKAAMLYVFLVLAVIWLIARFSPRTREAAMSGALLVASFACMLAPWMYRNYVQLGSFEVSQRAGAVLMMRAAHDQMTFQEYVGAIYFWAPERLQRPLGALLGFSRADAQRGGRVQRLNDGPSNFAADDLAAELAGRPDEAVSFYRSARAQRVQLQRAMAAAHNPAPAAAADEILKQRAMSVFLAHPWRHLALTLLFLWRGAAIIFPLLTFGFAVGLMFKRYELARFVLPSLGLIGLYALFTHFIPRYGAPTRAIAVVAAITACKLVWDEVARRRGLRAVAASELTDLPGNEQEVARPAA